MRMSSDPSDDSKATPQARLAPVRILLADDDAMVTKPLRKLLSNRGYVVTCVENGWDAATSLRTRMYDLLVVDICMPGNHELEILRTPELSSQNIPVIVITGHPSVETAIDALRSSVVDYFVKPFAPEVFLASVARAVVRGQAMGTVREIESRLGNVTTVLESLKSTLVTATEPLAPRPLSRTVHNTAVLRERLHTGEYVGLTHREREIILLLTTGQDTTEVASALHISVSTVRNHLKSIYRKLGVGSQVMLVRKLLS
jgi:DNA-binding NarL/FixJ family response regulator